ncbi:MAG: hypothetical protein IJY99_02455 [Alphaproteobacteria bacterium]|nr:hypothetical protein [Alphaproteobacteria bacterium]
MYKYFISLPLLLITCNAMTATCPSGYLAVSRDNNTKISTPCPSGYTATRTISHNCSATDSTCYPELLCTAGSYDLNVGTNTVPLWSTQFTTPSLKVKSGNTTCYTPMAADNVSGRLKVKNTSGVTYSHANLYECKVNISATGTNSYSVPTANSPNWTAVVDGKTIKGISFCGNISATVDTTKDIITVDTVTMSNNIYCWCRATTPYTSKWTYATYYSTNGYTGCYMYCSQSCASRLSGSGSLDTTFRSAMLNSMSRS